MWDDNTSRQGKELKPVEDAFSALNSIIESQELRVGSYRELVRVILPRRGVFNTKLRKYEMKKNVPVTIESSPVCCVADIPTQHLSYHSKRYGKMAIGFRRESLVQHGFNPVMYSLDNSFLSRAIIDGYAALDNIDVDWAISELDDLSENIDIVGVEDQLDDIKSYKEMASDCYERILAFIKTFEPKEFDSIYCEREWRSTENFNFEITDIAMIVLPRNVGEKNWYDEFIRSTHLPRTVPVLCWEDLIEH